jgi:glycosyltransferase involved in cell wall biosynthesis
VNENKIFIFQNFLKKEEIVFRQNEKITLVYAGRISKEKGVEDLIRIFLDSSPKNTRLIIIGDGPQLQYLRSNYQNSCISFEGLKSNLEVKKIISNSSGVIIRTNLFENQPTILCEASMLSKPSIFPDNGGINEFFPRDYLLKYDISTDESLITILNKIDNFEFDIQTIGEENNQFITKLLSKERLITNFDNIVEKF